MNLSDEVLNEKLSSNGRPKYKSTMHWALNDLKFAGLLEVVKFGVYKITNEGLKVSKKGLKAINRDWLRKNYKAFDDYILYGSQKDDKGPEQQTVEIISSDTPAEQLNKTEKIIKESVCTELLEALKTGTPAFFEKVVVDVIEKMGYGVGEVTQLSNDGGIDGIIKQDKLGLDKIYIQAKRFTENKVGRPEIQKFVGALVGVNASKGIFITTSDFTENAKDYQTPNKSLVLINGSDLANLMYEYDLGVSVEKVYVTKKIDSDYFED